MRHWRSASAAPAAPRRLALTWLMAASVVLCAPACGDDDEVVYDQFNDDGDTLTLQVGVDEVQDDALIDLHSTTGEVVIGTASVSPGGGPIGTVHTVVVVIDDEYEDEVDRVSVRLDSGERGEDEYDLDQDSADEGLYKLSIQSVGEDGETRDDVLTVRVWDEQESTTDTGD